MTYDPTGAKAGAEGLVTPLGPAAVTWAKTGEAWRRERRRGSMVREVKRLVGWSLVEGGERVMGVG